MSQAGHRNQRKAPAVEWMPRICDRDLFRPSIPRPSRGIKKWDRKASAGSDRSSFGKVRKIIDYGHIGQRDNDAGAVIKRRAAAPPRIHIGTWRSSSAASSTSLLNGVDVTIVPVFARRPGATSSSSAQLSFTPVLSNSRGTGPRLPGLRRHCQSSGSLAECGMTRHRQIRPHHLERGADQSLGLP